MARSRQCLIRDGLVVNIISADPDTYIPPVGLTVTPWAPGVQVGFTWDGSEFGAPPEPTPAELDARKTAEITRLGDTFFEVFFDRENRLRALESQTPLTREQALSYLKGLI